MLGLLKFEHDRDPSQSAGFNVQNRGFANATPNTGVGARYIVGGNQDLATPEVKCRTVVAVRRKVKAVGACNYVYFTAGTV